MVPVPLRSGKRAALGPERIRYPSAPPMSSSAPTSPLLRLALEAGPLGIFFAVNARAGIQAATAAFMVAIVVSLIASRILEKRYPVLPLVTAVFVLVFGGLTLILKDELFIKLKPTVVNSLFGAILLGGLATGRSLLKPLLGTALELDAAGWRTLTLRWGVFFLFLAALNEVIWRTVSTDTWVSFKVFGILPITLAFAFSQAPLIARHSPRPQAPDAPQ
jgi:intracellular septation protein